MAFFRRFFSFINNNGKSNNENEVTGDVTIATYYLGQTFAAKPNSDELKRASYLLMAKAKKDLEKNLIPTVYLCFESTTIFLRDARNHNCREYDVRKIVMSCIDARNQKLVAIFYDNASPYIGNGKSKSNMLECHLCLCKSKEIAKSAANKIGEMLSREYKLPSRQPTKKMEDSSVRLSKANYDDFDYENVSKFFQQKVFGLKENSVSSLSTPCGSVSTFATTTGCDSGCASTIASVDFRGVSDDMSSVNSVREPTIDEHNEFHSSFEDDSILDEQINSNNLRVFSNDTSSCHIEQKDSHNSQSEDENEPKETHSPRKDENQGFNSKKFEIATSHKYREDENDNHTISENDINDKEHGNSERVNEEHESIRDTSIYHNRYSVHYDLEDDDVDDVIGKDDDEKMLTSANDDVDIETDNDRSMGMRTPELERLLELGETNI